MKNKGFTPTPNFGVSLRSKRGFTLMEVIIAIAVIVSALLTLVSLISFSVSGLKPGGSKLAAVNLAQEGLEIVRNIRDSNWLVNKRTSSNWKDNLAEGDYRVQYDTADLLVYSSDVFKIDANGFYQYASGSDTLFKRKITISHIGNNQIKIVAEVTWQEKSKSYSVEAESRLYNWLEVTE